MSLETKALFTWKCLQHKEQAECSTEGMLLCSNRFQKMECSSMFCMRHQQSLNFVFRHTGVSLLQVLKK